MAELNREQHEELGGSFATEPFFNGWITSLGGLYVPGKSEQVAGKHYEAKVNELDGVNRRLLNAFQGYVYKDSADGDDEFSVKPITVEVEGMSVSYAGATAQGPLTTGVKYVWLNISNPSSPAIGFGASWPTVVHIPLEAIDMPASGSWLPSDMTRHSNRIALSPFRQGKFRKDFTYTSGAAFTVGSIPIGVMVMVGILITTAFNGSSPTIKVGELAGDDDIYVQTGDGTIGTIGYYPPKRGLLASTIAGIVGTIGGSGASAGAGAIIIEYVR